MAEFKNLNLSKALQHEEEEDALDRLMAGQTPEPVASPDAMLADLLADDDELTTRKPLAKAPTAPKSTPTERKKPRHVGTPRARATAKDAVLLAFLGKFRIATAEALSMLLIADPGPGTPGGGLTSVATIENRMAKLERLGLAQSASVSNFPIFYGVTQAGIAVARAYGHLLSDDEVDGKPVSGISQLNVPHRLAVSHLAAQFISPVGYFKKSRKLNPLKLEDLVSERTIERYQRDVQAIIETDRRNGNLVTSFGYWRQNKIADLRNDLRAKRLEPSEFLDYYPELWSLGAHSELLEDPMKDNHNPDLVLNFERVRTSADPVSVFIEVELTLKPQTELAKILRTYAHEFSNGLTYKHVVYFVGGDRAGQIVKAIKKADRWGLVESGRLRFETLTARDGVSPLSWVKTWSKAR